MDEDTVDVIATQMELILEDEVDEDDDEQEALRDAQESATAALEALDEEDWPTAVTQALGAMRSYGQWEMED